jgi:hypothetical protein
MRWTAFLWDGASRAFNGRPAVTNLVLVLAARFVFFSISPPHSCGIGSISPPKACVLSRAKSRIRRP